MTNQEFEAVPTIDKLNADLAEQKLQEFCLIFEACVASSIGAYSATRQQKRFATLLSRALGETMRTTAHVNGNRFENIKRFKFTASERTRFRNLKKLLEELTGRIDPAVVYLEKYRSEKTGWFSSAHGTFWRLTQCTYLLNQFGRIEEYDVSDVQNCFHNSLDNRSNNIKECRNTWKRGNVYERHSYAHLIQTIELADMFAKPRTEEEKGVMMIGSYTDQIEQAVLDIRRSHAADDLVYRVKVAVNSDRAAMALLPEFVEVLYDCLYGDSYFSRTAVSELHDSIALETLPKSIHAAWSAGKTTKLLSIELVSKIQYNLSLDDVNAMYDLLVSPMFDCIDHFSGYSSYSGEDAQCNMLLTFTELADVFV